MKNPPPMTFTTTDRKHKTISPLSTTQGTPSEARRA